MDLESRMREKSRECHILTDGLQHERIELRLSLSDALAIAKEYAEECCKKQREICATEADKTKVMGIDRTLAKAIKNAPLATEVE